MLVSAISDIGLVRPVNEDNFAVVTPELFVVADGMGGHVAGEIASKLAIDTLVRSVQSDTAADDLCLLLEQGIRKANQAVFQQAQAVPEYAGMGTTLTVVLINQETVFWGHVGDSRLYLFRNNQLHQLTNDHSLVWELVRAGTISMEEARSHPQKNILTRAVGTDELITIDLDKFVWLPGDALLLCTDGLTNMVDDEQICQILSAQADLDSRLHCLIDQAKSAGGLDNITAVMMVNEDGVS